MGISQKVKGVIMCNLRGTIFYMKTILLQNFHICIGVPLINLYQKINKAYLICHKSQNLHAKFHYNSNFEHVLLIQGINQWEASGSRSPPPIKKNLTEKNYNKMFRSPTAMYGLSFSHHVAKQKSFSASNKNM